MIDIVVYPDAFNETIKFNRNTPCRCGSGLKYKNCHLHQLNQKGKVKKFPASIDINNFKSGSEQLFAVEFFSKLLKDQTDSGITTFIPRYYKILHSLSSRYYVVMHKAKQLGYLESNDSYSTDKHMSKGYRISGKHLNSGTKKVKIINNIFNEKVEKSEERIEDSKELKKMEFYIGKLKILKKEALQFIEENESVWYDPNKKQRSKSKKPSKILTKEEKRSMYIDLINNFNSPDKRFISKSSRNGRVTSNFSTFPKALKKFLRYEGKKLQTVDMVSAQPTLLISFILESVEAILKETKDFVELEALRLLLNETFKYAELIESGLFYERIAEEAGLDISVGKVRDKLKKNVLVQIFYGKTCYDGKVKQAFKRLFPNILNFIKEIKKEKFNSLAIALQRMESKIFIDEVATILLNKNIPIFTNHDSISIPENYDINIVTSAIFEASKKYHIYPTLKLENTNKKVKAEGSSVNRIEELIVLIDKFKREMN